MRKVFSIVLCLFGVVSLLSIPTISKKNTLRTNLEVESITTKKENRVYLKNDEDYFVEVPVNLEKNDIESIINLLKEDKTIDSYKGYLPKDLEIIQKDIKGDTLYLNLSKEVDKQSLQGLVHSLLKQNQFEKVKITIEGKNEKEYDKSFPINKERNSVNQIKTDKVVVYYIDDFDKRYLVPVTKYESTPNEKIKVILEELKADIPQNLISFVGNQLELIDYEIDKDCMVLNFNKELIADSRNKKIILEELSKSIFENYDVSTILFKVEGKLEDILTNNG